MNFLKSVALGVYLYPVRWCAGLVPRKVFLSVFEQIVRIIVRVNKAKTFELVHMYQKMAGPRPGSQDSNFRTIRRMAEKSRVRAMMDYTEFLFFPRLGEDNIDKLISIQGRHHLDDNLGKGKGVILSVFHFGTFTFVFPCIGFHGYKSVTASATNQWRKDAVNRRKGKMSLKAIDMQWEVEKNMPVKWLYVGRKNLKKDMLDTLKKGEIVTIFADGGIVKNQKVPICLGGIEFDIATFIFHLSKQSGAPVIPAFIIRNDDFTSVMKLQSPVSICEGDSESDYRRDARNLSRRLYGQFLEYPCHYLNQMQNFKTMGRLRDAEQSNKNR